MKKGIKLQQLLFVFMFLYLCSPAHADEELNLDWKPIPGTGMVEPALPHEPGTQPERREGSGIDFGYLVVTLSPAGAKLSIDGEEKSPGSYRVSVGPHSLRLEKVLYHSLEKTVSIAPGETQSVSLSLNPAFGTLEVNSDPSGAQVRIEGIRVGSTPYKDERVRSGSYRISLSHQWYDDWSDTFQVKDRETTRVQGDLPPNFGTLSVMGSPSNASVTIDGKTVSGTRDVRLLPGHHRVKVEAPYHFFQEKTVRVARGKGETFRYTLKPQQGSISVESTPYGAEILLDGKETGKQTPAVLTDVMAGPHTVKVQKTDHQPGEEEVTVKSGGVETVRVTLQKGPIVERDGVYVLYDSGIVKDTSTGLEWKAGPDKDTNWHEARSWVQNLNLDGGVWRMPTMDELEGLYRRRKGQLNMTPLLKTTGWWVWSVETVSSSFARHIDINDADRDWSPFISHFNFRAFAVRSRGDG